MRELLTLMAESGKCSDADPSFFDDARSPVKRLAAARICGACPIYRECLYGHYERRGEVVGIRAAHNFTNRGKVLPIQRFDYGDLPTITNESTIEPPDSEGD